MDAPTLEEFLELAQRGNLIPVTRKLLADFETPLSAYWKLRGHQNSFLFESVEGGEHLGRYSFVGCNPRAVIRQDGNSVKVIEGSSVTQEYRVGCSADGSSDPVIPDGLAVVEKYLSQFRPVNLPGLPRFTGGAVGFIGYEFIHDLEPSVPRPERDELKTPTLYFLIADQVLVFDRVNQTLTVLVNAVIAPGQDPRESYALAVQALDQLVGQLTHSAPSTPIGVVTTPPDVPFVSNTTREQFEVNVHKASQYIRAGDIIQVVGSQRFSAPVKATPLDVYRAVRSVNPSPYLFILELEGMALVGASPELHVRCVDGRVEIRPIAGTRPRGRNLAEDQSLEKELLADPKERAEHVMLVDLARNDIGRVCEFGSVRVQELMITERYSHVMHIVSQVEGRLAAGQDAFDLMRTTFPAGTLSGAPKIRAMQIIAELEGTSRGPYGGCVGYFGFNGNADHCITIRTALIKDGMAYVQAGGGWVNDSVAANEFQETINKSRAMIKAISLAESFSSSH